MIDGGVVGGGKVRVDAGICRCLGCPHLFLHRGSSYIEGRKEKRRSRGRESVREDYMTSSFGHWLTRINSLETSLMWKLVKSENGKCDLSYYAPIRSQKPQTLTCPNTHL